MAQVPSLRRYREQAGLSQSDVAERLGVTQQVVSKWEQDNDPGDRWLELAGLFGVKESYPAAPFEPKARRAWFDQRNAGIAQGVSSPTGGTFGGSGSRA